jgi:putative addiction module component (TIGR02574 family)
MNKPLLDELLRLPRADRLQMVDLLLDSLDEADLPLTEKQIAECERELAEHRSDPSGALPWPEVKEWLRSRRR